MAWGRIVVGGVDLREEVAARETSGDLGGLTVAGQESHPPSTAAHVLAAHHNLTALVGQTVPVTFSDKPGLDGHYTVTDGDSQLVKYANGSVVACTWSLTLARVGTSRDTEVESRVPTIARTTTLPVVSAGFVETRRNLHTNPSATSGTGSWGGYYGPGGDGSGTGHEPGAGVQGPGFVRLTWTTAPSSTGGGVWAAVNPATPGQVYACSMWVRPSIAQQVRPYIEWKDSGGTVLSTSAGAVTTAPADVWTRVWVTGVAPASTASLTFTAYADPSGTTWSVGDTMDGDGALVETVPYLGDYFDGGTTDTATHVHAWTGSADGSASVQGSAPEFWHAPAVGAASYWTGPTVPAGSVVRASADGDVLVHLGIPEDVAPRWTVPVGGYRDGAARIEFDGILRVGTNTPPLVVWQVDNGLVRLLSGNDGQVSVACWDTGEWRSAHSFTFWTSADSYLTDTPELTVLRNDPEEAVIRLSYPLTPGRLTVDLSLRRGSRFVAGVIKRHAAASFSVERIGEVEFTERTGGFSQSTADADGNRFVVGSSKPVTVGVTPAAGTTYLWQEAPALLMDFFLGHEVGDPPQAGDRYEDLLRQYLGSTGERARVVRR